MIKIHSSYQIVYQDYSSTKFLELDSSKERLFNGIATYLRENGIDQIKIDLQASSLLVRSLTLFEYDNYFWIVAEKMNSASHCKAIFYSFMAATDFFIFQLLKPYPRTVDWANLLQDKDFINQIRSIMVSDYFIINYSRNSKWLRIESDFPSDFFKTSNDVFELLGYVDGQKFIFESMWRYMGNASSHIAECIQRCGYCDFILGEMGRSVGNLTICEAGDYWIVTAGERGSVNFNSLFCSYQDAVDSYLIRNGNLMHKTGAKKMPWKDI